MRRYLALFLVVVALTTACGESATGNDECPPDAACAPDQSARIDVLEEMRGRAEAGSSVRPFDSLTETLGNVEYSIAGGPAAPLTEAVVVGVVTDVAPGRAFSDEKPGSPDGVGVDFDDPDAIWRSVHALVEVETVISGEAGRVAEVGFAFDPRVPLQEIRAELVGMGSMLLFLNRSPVFDYDAGAYGTVSDGALLGLVDQQGNITLPLIENQDAKTLLREASVHRRGAEGCRRPAPARYPAG